LKVPTHIAIIMDGNGRWARRRGLPRTEGHRRGMKTLRAIIKGCLDLKVSCLTIYAFSSENWRRSEEEVQFLMRACEAMIASELSGMLRDRVRLRHIGRKEGLPNSLARVLENAENLTRSNDRLNLQLAFNYGGRQEIVEACRSLARRVKAGDLDPAAIDEASVTEALTTAGLPDPDLVIRTSGEMRLSNYLLWQSAYAEFYVTRTLWPDFSVRELRKAMEEFSRRQRRYGGADD
jgi:undecaprenyl diphosphate synthase